MRVGWTQAALAGSVVANCVLLWLFLSASAAPSSTTAAKVARPVAETAPAAFPMPAARERLSPSATPGDAVGCAAALRDARSRIERYEKKLPPSTRFEIADAGDGAQELRVRPEIDRVLGECAHTLECRGAICKVEIVEKSDGIWDWTKALQSDPSLQRLLGGAEYHGRTPAQDPVTGEELWRSDVYLVINDPDVTFGLDVVTLVWEDLERSGFVRACAERNAAAKGVLQLAIVLDQETHEITVVAGGTLPNTAVGTCLVAAVERAYAATTVPVHVTSVHWGRTITLPDP